MNTSIKLQPININNTVIYTCRYLFIELLRLISTPLNKYLNSLIPK